MKKSWIVAQAVLFFVSPYLFADDMTMPSGNVEVGAAASSVEGESAHAGASGELQYYDQNYGGQGFAASANLDAQGDWRFAGGPSDEIRFPLLKLEARGTVGQYSFVPLDPTFGMIHHNFLLKADFEKNDAVGIGSKLSAGAGYEFRLTDLDQHKLRAAVLVEGGKLKGEDDASGKHIAGRVEADYLFCTNEAVNAPFWFMGKLSHMLKGREFHIEDSAWCLNVDAYAAAGTSVMAGAEVGAMYRSKISGSPVGATKSYKFIKIGGKADVFQPQDGGEGVYSGLITVGVMAK